MILYNKFKIFLIIITLIFITGCSRVEESINFNSPGTFPIADEKINLTIMVENSARFLTEYEKNLSTKYLEEKTGVHITFDIVNSVDESRDVATAANNMPDIFMGETTNTKILQYGLEGKVLPLNDLIDKYAPNIKKNLDSNPALKAAITAPDGNIYGLPDINDDLHGAYGSKIWINTTWLKNLGLDMPETLKEFKNVLIAFRDNDPNGNGLKDEIPYISSTDGWMVGFPGALFNSFIYYNVELNGLFREDGVIKSVYNDSRYRDTLSFTAELYREGLIDKDAFTMKHADLRQLGERAGDNILGAVNAGYWALFTNHGGPSGRYKEYDMTPPLANDDGFRTAGFYMKIDTNTFSISSTCSSPEAAIRWADYIATPEGSYNMQFGPEGIGWKKPPEGAVGLNGEPALFVRLAHQDKNTSWGFDPGPPRYQPASQRLGEMAAQIEDRYEPTNVMTRLTYDTINKFVPYKPDPDMVLPPAFLSVEVNNEVLEIEDELYNYIDNAELSFMSGYWDVDDDEQWQSYLDEVERLGINKILSIYQKAYDK